MNIERATLVSRMAKEFITSIQIDPPNKPCLEELIIDLQFLLDNGIDIVDINSSRRLSIDSMMLAIALKQQFGFEVIPHVAVRDSSLNGLANQILAAYTLAEIRNFLVITGDPYETTSIVTNSIGVFQTDSMGAIGVFDRHLRQSSLSLKITFGAAINQNEKDLQYEEGRIGAKILAGADFFMSQPVFNSDQALSAAKFYKKYSSKPLLMGIWPLINQKTTENIYKGKVSGVKIPDQVYQDALNLSTTEALKNWGVSKALDLINFIKENKIAQGIYIVAPSKKPNQLTDLIKNLS